MAGQGCPCDKLPSSTHAATSQTKARPFFAPDRAISIPDMGRGASEILTGRNDRDLKHEKQYADHSRGRIPPYALCPSSIVRRVLPSQGRQQSCGRRARPFLELRCADIGFQKSALSPLKRHFILTPAYGQMGTFTGFEVDFRRLKGYQG